MEVESRHFLKLLQNVVDLTPKEVIEIIIEKISRNDPL